MKINNFKKIFGGIAALAFVFALSTFAVSAYQGDPNIQGPNYSQERHDAMEKVFESGNYQDWADLMSDNGGRITDVINENNFSSFVKAHELAVSGDLDEARAIRAELGLGMRNGQGKHNGDCDGTGHRMMKNHS